MKLRCRTTLREKMLRQLDLLAVSLISSVDVRKNRIQIRQSGSPSTCGRGTREQDLHSVPCDAGLTVAEMVSRGVCGRGRRGDQQGLVLGGIASVEPMIGYLIE